MPKLIEIRDLVKTGLHGLSLRRRRESSPLPRQRRLGFRKLFGSRTSQTNEALYNDASGMPRDNDATTLGINVETEEESTRDILGFEAVNPSNVMVCAGDVGGQEASLQPRSAGLLGCPIPLPHAEDERFPIDIESVCGDNNHAGASIFDGAFDVESAVPAGSTLFETQVNDPVPARSLGWTIPLPEVDDEPSHESRRHIRIDVVLADTSGPLRLQVDGSAISAVDASLPISSVVEDGSRGSNSSDDLQERLTPPNDPDFWPLPTEMLQICDTRPHVSGCPWRDLELATPWSNQTTVSLLCPLLVQQARRLLLHGKSTLIDVTFGQLYEDPAQPPHIRRGASLIKLDHLESLSITSSTHLGFLFDKTVVRLPKLKRLSLTSHRGRSGSSAPVVLDHTLDVPWANLESLSLANESSSPCDILLLISKCDSLRQFSWSDDMEYFAVSGRLPASKLSHLEEITIHSSSGGCDTLVDALFPEEGLQNVKKATFASLPSKLLRGSDQARSKLTEVAITEPLSLDNLISLITGLKQLQLMKCVLNDHHAAEGMCPRCFPPTTASRLRYLDLSTSCTLRPLWESLQAPGISVVKVSSSNQHVNVQEDVQPFLAQSRAFSITYLPQNSNTHLWTFSN